MDENGDHLTRLSKKAISENSRLVNIWVYTIDIAETRGFSIISTRACSRLLAVYAALRLSALAAMVMCLPDLHR